MGRGGSGTATQRRTVGGLPVETTAGFGDDRFADACPGAGGLLHGKVRTHYAISSNAPLPRRLNLTQGFDFEAKATLTGHVGSDGKLRDYDLATEVEYWLRVTVRGPTGSCTASRSRCATTRAWCSWASSAVATSSPG